jgi:hypothetical protein
MVNDPVLLEPTLPPELKLPVPVQPVVTYWIPVPPEAGVVTVDDRVVPAVYQPAPVALSYVDETAK